MKKSLYLSLKSILILACMVVSCGHKTNRVKHVRYMFPEISETPSHN